MRIVTSFVAVALGDQITHNGARVSVGGRGGGWVMGESVARSGG